MFRRRELFILAGVVAVDLDQARRDSLEVAMNKIEQATRDAVLNTDQKLIDARVAPADNGRAVLVDMRFSGDRAGAIAALERWSNTVKDVAAVRGILRTLLRGPNGLNLEWCDDEYQKELQARWESAEVDSTPEIGAQVPDEGARPTRRAWLTDWEEAARHPRSTRLFLAASFALVGVIFATLAGDLNPWSLAIAAALGAVAGAAVGEYAMRSLRGRKRATDAH